VSRNGRAWVGAKDQVTQYSRWVEAIAHEWEKESNTSIVFLVLGIKPTAKIRTQRRCVWCGAQEEDGRKRQRQGGFDAARSVQPGVSVPGDP
jgi:hypothetical protein